MSKPKLGFCLTGSFCTFQAVIEQMKILSETYDILPIMSYHAYQLDTRFGKAAEHIKTIEAICGKKIIHDLPSAEPIGPQKMTDLMLVAPCSGNTLAKLALGITDSPSLMAVKSHLRNNKPVVIAVSTNDALSGSGKNIGALLNLRNYYFVPFCQDNCTAKPTSMVADFTKIPEALAAAQEHRQLQPIVF